MAVCDLQEWLSRGRQRRAVAAAFRGIVSGVQLWREAAKSAPRLQLRDVRAILREFEARDLSRCLNPTATSGRLFEPTTAGLNAFEPLWAVPAPESVPLSSTVDLSLASYLSRARVRQAVFRKVLQEDFGGGGPKSASEIKRALRDTCPLTLNQTSRALHELESADLIGATAPDDRRHRFVPTVTGLRVAQWLQMPCGRTAISAGSNSWSKASMPSIRRG